MKHEKIIKRPDGTRVKIDVSLYLDIYRNNAQYDVDVTICAPGKRTFREVYSGDDYLFRKLSMQDRAAFILESQLKVVTAEEIYAAKLEAWELLKPTM